MMRRPIILSLIEHFWGEAMGFALIREDGTCHNCIRGDLIDADALVIVEDGRSFVRTRERDGHGFRVYREGHRTHHYHSGSRHVGGQGHHQVIVGRRVCHPLSKTIGVVDGDAEHPDGVRLARVDDRWFFVRDLTVPSRLEEARIN